MKFNTKTTISINPQTMYLSIAILVLVLLIMFVGYLWYGTLQRAATTPVVVEQTETPSVSNTQKTETDEEVFARLRGTATSSGERIETDEEVFERLSARLPTIDSEDEGPGE